MFFLFFISGALLVLISMVVGYAMGERKSDKTAATGFMERGLL